MKIKKILTLFFIVLSFVLIPILTLKADEIDEERNAYIYSRTARDYIPVFHVKDSEVEMYEYEGELVFDFRSHFHIIDQRKDILKMHHIVDGEKAPIDLGGYTWDFGGFDISVSGQYTIKISYVGANKVEISSTVKLTVIDEDTIAPVIYGLFDRVEVDVKADFLTNVSNVSAIDNVDGLIKLTNENFSGHEEIEGSPLNKEHIVTLTVTDKAGNSVTRTFTAIVKDLYPPVILNVKNIETKKGIVVDYKSHLVFEDNYSPANKIEVEYIIVTDETGETATGETEVDFNKVGEVYIKVIATDEGGAEAVRIFRVIIKDSLSLTQILLIINGIIILIGGLSFGAIAIVQKNKKRV